MVLQKGGDIPVWGSAEPGQKVVVSLDGRSAEAQADVNGRWEVRLDLRDSSPGPFEMVVEAGQKIVIQDVVIGEVWLAAGQSNMAYGLEKSTGAAAEIAASADPMLREFKVDTNAGAPQIAYRETLTKEADGEGKLVKQSGGRGQYGHVILKVY
ncbi:MAG TPA: hypothetical protein PLS03_05115, partial [Terrimicrobiaceae bacterium]|nr:hypothetical protein [Terrimicrobiaceae bacterium]